MSSDQSRQSPAERITVAISIVILAAILGLAGWSSYATGDAPPTIEVEVHMEDMRETESGFYVPVSITNTGGLTGKNVIVTGELVTEDSEPESAEVTIDFLSGGESERAELVFSTNPNDGEFTVGPTSFLMP